MRIAAERLHLPFAHYRETALQSRAEPELGLLAELLCDQTDPRIQTTAGR